MGDKVEDLRLFDGRHVEHILDILKVSSRAKAYELDAQAHEYYEADLAGSRQFSLRQCYTTPAREQVGCNSIRTASKADRKT
jgi:hypothetical protein